eukprot:1093105-Pyramimonas_sp.AAC.1
MTTVGCDWPSRDSPQPNPSVIHEGHMMKVASGIRHQYTRHIAGQLSTTLCAAHAAPTEPAILGADLDLPYLFQAAGILLGDLDMIGQGLSTDCIVEPARAPLIPGFAAVKAAAME